MKLDQQKFKDYLSALNVAFSKMKEISRETVSVKTYTFEEERNFGGFHKLVKSDLSKKVEIVLILEKEVLEEKVLKKRVDVVFDHRVEQYQLQEESEFDVVQTLVTILEKYEILPTVEEFQDILSLVSCFGGDYFGCGPMEE